MGSASTVGPAGSFGGWLRLTLTAIVPGAGSHSAAEALRSRLTGRNLALACVALALVFASRRFWLRGLKCHSGASA